MQVLQNFLLYFHTYLQDDRIFAVIVFMGVLCILALYFSFEGFFLDKQIRMREQHILELFHRKIHKIPAFLESIREHVYLSDRLFERVILVYRGLTLRKFNDILDIVIVDRELHAALASVMKVANKDTKIHLDGNFLYIRDFIMIYESEMKKEFQQLHLDIVRLNKIIFRKNITIFGFLFPLSKKPELL